MRRCAFLSTDDLEDFVVYDELAYPAFAALGVEVEAVSWRAPVDWSRFELVVIRSPWDYQDDVDRFLDVLAQIDEVTRLENPLDVVRWNVRKEYLRDLEGRGVPIVPSLWRDAGAALDSSLFDELDAERVVIKPLVSGNADHTYPVDADELRARRGELEAIFASRPFLVQPFMPSVVDEGEYSLFYFGGEYSHALLKTPAEGDFRVQEEHGGRLRAIRPQSALRAAAERVLAALDRTLLYARVDLVRGRHSSRTSDDAVFRLMELELIEPSLYFSFDPASPERFARAAVDLIS